MKPSSFIASPQFSHVGDVNQKLVAHLKYEALIRNYDEVVGKRSPTRVNFHNPKDHQLPQVVPYE
jgi:hypothetical protein